MTTAVLAIREQYAQSIRWDFDRQTMNDRGEALCSVCYASIPDPAVPLMMWLTDRRYMATICDRCTNKVLEVRTLGEDCPGRESAQ